MKMPDEVEIVSKSGKPITRVTLTNKVGLCTRNVYLT